MRQFLHILSFCIKSAFFLFALMLLIFTLFFSFCNQNDGAEWFGYRFFAVLSNSMSPLFESGDIVVVQRCDPSQLHKGDVISFYSPDPSRPGIVITHQIDQVVVTDGKISFITKGTSARDLYPVSSDQVLGIYRSRLAKAGRLATYLKSPTGYLLLVIVPFLLFLCGQTVRFLRLLRQYRQQTLYQLNQKQLTLQRIIQENACVLQYNRYLTRHLEDLLDSLKQTEKEEEP